MFLLSCDLFIVAFINQFDLPLGKMSDTWKHYPLNKGKTVTCKICGNTSQNLTTKSATESKEPKISFDLLCLKKVMIFQKITNK